jgi:predicted DNA helicase
LSERPAFQKSEDMRQEALDLIEERRNLTPPTGQWRRGLSDEEIHHLADENRTSRGLSERRIQEMSEYMRMSDRIDDLFEECDRLEERAIRRLLDDVDVVCSTNTGAGSDLLAGIQFDWVCVDEATQATEPSTLIPATKGKKLVMAGDHRQLQPTVLSEEASERGLPRSLFERLVDEYGSGVRSLLTVQYRMHEKIMAFSNEQFYDGAMVSSPKVVDHTLDDLSSYHPESLRSALRRWLNPRPPVQWIDTTPLPGSEETHEGSHSSFNRTEVDVVSALLDTFESSGLRASDLAVIAPYKAHVELLRDRINDESIEIDTVDGFQGREKEVVLISFVRSNSSGAIGFLSDERRLNVSLTRARKKLILVGDVSTLTCTRMFDELHQYVEERGTVEPVTRDIVRMQ